MRHKTSYVSLETKVASNIKSNLSQNFSSVEILEIEAWRQCLLVKFVYQNNEKKTKIAQRFVSYKQALFNS